MVDKADSSRDLSTVDALDHDRPRSIEAYETGDTTVLYDAYHPLAWIESTAAIPIDKIT